MEKKSLENQIETEILYQENYCYSLEKNNESYLEKIRKFKDFFYKRNKVVIQSRRDNICETRNYLKLKEKYPQKCINDVIYMGKYAVLNPNINNRINELLVYDGFDLNDEGTKYLKELIELLYHERTLYYEEVDNELDYFNLSDYSNIHYQMLGVPKEKVIYSIIQSISTNKMKLGCPIDEIVYSIVDQINGIVYSVVDQIERYSKNRENKKEKPYKKLLSK